MIASALILLNKVNNVVIMQQGEIQNLAKKLLDNNVSLNLRVIICQQKQIFHEN